MAVFRDRVQAGQRLANELTALGNNKAVVLGLVKGGVAVAAQVARQLGAPLDVMVVRKIGMPGNPELGIGAIGEDDVLWIDSRTAALTHVDPSELESELKHGLVQVTRMVKRFRGDRPPLPLEGRTALIVDDGLATGVTAKAAAKLARRRGAEHVIVAAPVGSEAARELIGEDADRVITLETQEPWVSLSHWYREFPQVSDDEVLGALKDMELGRELVLPDSPIGVVVFAHGSGSSRKSPRNRAVAETLRQAGIGTLLIDLLSEKEAEQQENVFDIHLLTDRLIAATGWLESKPEAKGLPIGFFGASTGAAAALSAAARLGSSIAAVVSRGGRVDLAGDALGSVNSPTLLIVGEIDEEVLLLNRRALHAFRNTEAELSVVPGASHLFGEPGALERVAAHATEWFLRWFGRRRFPAEAA
jgi:putative phosphoribosyl transferase